MDREITDNAVETVARAFYEQNDPGGWDDLDYESKESRLCAAEGALKAVWPEPLLTREEAHMAAQAIGQWIDEDDGGLAKEFPREAAALESVFEKLEQLAEHGV